MAVGLILSTALEAPAQASETMAGADYTQARWQGPPPAAPGLPTGRTATDMPPPSREAWLAECRRRSTPVEIEDDYGWGRHRHHRSEAAGERSDRCASYLADYEAWTATVQAVYATQHQIAIAPPTGCCERRSTCRQTVEYVEEYVPQRRAIRRPDKRIRIAPDKRSRVQ